jgi:squalene-associated FAD-dependent desaturase
MSAGSVVVVGGGLAGITAALDCAQAGAEVTLLEARGRLGGAAYSFTRGGLTVDNGQHVFLRCCSDYSELLERIGARGLVSLQPRLDVAVLAPGGRQGHLRRDDLPAPLHLASSLLRYPFIGVRERLALTVAMQRLRAVDPDDPHNDVRAFGDWLREQHQSPGVIDSIWELIARPTLNLSVYDASLAQAAQVFQLGLLQDPGAGDIGWAVAPLSEIHDRAAAQALARAGVRVQLRSTAKAIVPAAETEAAQVAKHAPEASFSTGPDAADATLLVATADGGELRADAVVLAVPPARAAGLLPAAAGLDPAFADHLGHSAIVNLHVVYDRTVLEHPFAACVGTPVQWIFDRSASSGLDSGQYVTVSLSAADDEFAVGEELLSARYLPELERVLPAAGAATVKEFFVTREHSATFRAAPGARAWRPPARTRLPGLALAGAWTDTGWPATMEGAVRSGHSAARAALEQLANVHHAPAHGVVVSG